MQQQEQSAQIEMDEENATPQAEIASASQESAQVRQERLDWPALIAALAVAAFFALTARFNSLPAPSYIPAAVFSATGCGLLVTAVRKLRKRAGTGLLEAGLGGFGMALLQFAVAFTYPGVFSTIATAPDYARAFLLTWGLVALFAIILSLAGATIGHLAFSPLRPLPARAQKQRELDEEDEEEEEDDEADSATRAIAENESEVLPAKDKGEDEEEEGNEDEEESEEIEEEDEVEVASAQPRRSWPNYVITVLLLGLLPMMAGYVFAATYDFVLNLINVNAISPGLYPTLSLLTGLLPWKLAASISMSNSNEAFIAFTLLWRIPDSPLVNLNLFDVQTLESMVFTATGLALLLTTRYKSDTPGVQRQSAPLSLFLLLQALLGLIIILPANLWLLRGLEGILQFQTLLAQLPTIQLLNPLLFTLNLLTGMLFCIIVGLIVRRQYQLWTRPRAKKPAPHAEEDRSDTPHD